VLSVVCARVCVCMWVAVVAVARGARLGKNACAARRTKAEAGGRRKGLAFRRGEGGQRLGRTAAVCGSALWVPAALDVRREPSKDGAAKVGGGCLLAHELDGVRAALGGEAAQQGLEHVVAEGRLE